MQQSKYAITPDELVAFYDCLSSQICTRIFQLLLKKNLLNVSAVSRAANCTNRAAVKHLRNLAKLGIVNEESYAGRHTFALNSVDFTVLMEQVIETLEARKKDALEAKPTGRS